MNTKEMLVHGKSFLLKCKRVWHILKKPTMDEFWMVTKISALGIAVIGVLGFAISIVVNMFF
ncbi:MAG: protein translocase SEC61 complex subunit gamma [Nanoarchaeota archaeon]